MQSAWNLFLFSTTDDQKHLNEEKYAYVRITMAQHVGRLSKVALAFLNQSCDHNYDEELKILHQYFQNLVAQLLTDPINCVRLALLFTPENCSQLCTFFGRQKTNEIILSHIITFLNDKVRCCCCCCCWC